MSKQAIPRCSVTESIEFLLLYIQGNVLHKLSSSKASEHDKKIAVQNHTKAKVNKRENSPLSIKNKSVSDLVGYVR